MTDKREVCGTCKYNKWYEDEKDCGFICDNPICEFYRMFNMFTDSCDEWEAK